MRRGAYSRKYGTKRYYYGFKRRPQRSAAFLEKKFNLVHFLMHCVTQLTLTNKLLVKGQNKKK